MAVTSWIVEPYYNQRVKTYLTYVATIFDAIKLNAFCL